MEGSTPGAAGDVTESGWSNSVIFLQYLQNHFVYYVPCGLDEPVLLLLDWHRSNVSVAAVEWAKEHNIVLHVLPAHTSHIYYNSPWMLVTMALYRKCITICVTKR